MAYLTAQQLRDAVNGNSELAQVATPREYRPISAELMRKAIDAESYVGDPDEALATLALGRITKALDDASDLVDNHLRGLYVVPLATPPDTIKEIMVRLTRYALHDERASAEIAARYKEAMGWLRDIREGVIQLAVAEGDTAHAGGPAHSAGSGLYTVSGLSAFRCPYSL